MSVTTIC